jgi:hypothetical protein
MIVPNAFVDYMRTNQGKPGMKAQYKPYFNKWANL